VVEAKETSFKSERMGDLKLFPGHHSASSHFVGLNFKSAVFQREHVRLLSEDSGQQTDDGPGEEATISSGVASVEEGILLFRMTVQVAVDPNLPVLLLCKYFEHLFDCVDFRLVIWFWVDPLSVQVYTGDSGPIVATDHSVWVQAGYEDESVVPPKEFSFSLV